MRILVATDAWHPQVNGVVRTLTMMAETARSFGVDVSFLTPQSFPTFAMPSYRDLRVALPYPGKTARLIADARPASDARGITCLSAGDNAFPPINAMQACIRAYSARESTNRCP